MAEKSDKLEKEKKVTGAPEVPKDLHEKHLGKEDAPEKPDKEEPSGSEKQSEPASEADTNLDDTQTDEAVEDIIRSESDELLDAQDAKTEKVKPTGKKSWWRRAWLRWALAVVLLAVAGLMAYPSTRYWILNAGGVRVSASVEVKDGTTGQPLKNVTVTIGGAQSQTDSDGKAMVEKIKLGPNTLKLERIAFASLEKQVVLGLGSNPLGTFELDAVGAQYTMVVRDLLSGQPIEGAEATSGTAAARSDAAGKIVLTLDKSDGSDAATTVSAPGYRSDQFTLKVEVTNDLVLVPSAKEVFVSKESGKYDLYTIDADGKNKKVILAGTGLETGNIGLAVSPDGERAALVSTRDDQRTTDGRLLNTLSLVNVATGDFVVLDRGEQIQLMDWVGNRIVYHMVANVATDAADRNRISSYDYKTNSRAQLASANQIRSAASALGAVYFTDDAQYYRIQADGSGKSAVVDKEVWATYRTSYEELTLQTPAGWYKVNLQNGSATSIGEPSSYASHIFVTNQPGKQAVWVDKQALQIYDVAAAKSTSPHTQNGLAYPVRWLTDTAVVFRVANGQEIADYVMGAQGGTPRKLTNTTGTYGINPAF
ncbi:MAG: hypothetical protein ACREGD_03050 [Candidatus Saccharimonadales bacterium]